MKVTLVFLALISFSGCVETEPARYINFFTWSPDGSKIIAVVSDAGKPSYGQEIVHFNRDGAELSKVSLEKSLTLPDLTDRVSLIQDGKSFFAQSGHNIYLVNSDNGSVSLVAEEQEFFANSSSGDKIFTWRTWQAVPHDTNEYAILTVNGTSVISESSGKFSIKKSFSPYFGNPSILFLNDSTWVSCYADTGVCSLTFFDEKFNVIYSTNDRNGFYTPAMSSISNKIAYVGYSNFYIFNIADHSVKPIRSTPDYVHSLEISPESDFIVYTLSDEKSNFFNPSSVVLYNLKTNEEKKLASGISSSAQISPDGKYVAYFTSENRDIHLHVVPVP